jgi:hypothetical protein
VDSFEFPHSDGFERSSVARGESSDHFRMPGQYVRINLHAIADGA